MGALRRTQADGRSHDWLTWSLYFCTTGYSFLVSLGDWDGDGHGQGANARSGKRHSKSHTLCRRCGNRSFHKQKHSEYRRLEGGSRAQLGEWKGCRGRWRGWGRGGGTRTAPRVSSGCRSVCGMFDKPSRSEISTTGSKSASPFLGLRPRSQLHRLRRVSLATTLHSECRGSEARCHSHAHRHARDLHRAESS